MKKLTPEEKQVKILLNDYGLEPIKNNTIETSIHWWRGYLNGLGVQFDMTWSFKNHKFDDFQTFLDETIEKSKGNSQHINREVELELLKDRYSHLRKTPINSLDDLYEYDLIISHTSTSEKDVILNLFYQNDKIIFAFPSDSSSSVSVYGLTGVAEGLHVDKSNRNYIIDQNKYAPALLYLIEHIAKTKNNQER